MFYCTKKIGHPESTKQTGISHGQTLADMIKPVAFTINMTNIILDASRVINDNTCKDFSYNINKCDITCNGLFLWLILLMNDFTYNSE